MYQVFWSNDAPQSQQKKVAFYKSTLWLIRSFDIFFNLDPRTWSLCDHCVRTPWYEMITASVFSHRFITTLGISGEGQTWMQGRSASLFSLNQWNVKRDGEIWGRGRGWWRVENGRGGGDVTDRQTERVIRTRLGLFLFFIFFWRTVKGEGNWKAWWLLENEGRDGQVWMRR